MRRKIVFLPYDFDTAIGINNEGTLEFSYNLEDIDQTEGGADIFNGQQSVLWKNLRATYFDELRSMFQTLRSTGALSYEKVERMFEEHQAKWPEAVFNEDAWFKYLAPLVEKGNASYLSMLQGSKAEQRKWWLYNRFRYMDSKYNAGDSLSDVITVRGYAKSDITVEPYADVYASVKYGSYLVQKRAARHMKTTLECPLDNVNDTEIYIYSASQLMDVGDLSGLLVGYADFSKAVRLQSLKLGDASASYSNGNLKELYLGNNELLRTIDVRNCPALTQAVVITGCSNIEHVYFDGTSITGLELPDGGILKTLHLPSTMTALSILNQPSLTEFVFPAGAALTTLRLENVSTAVDSLMMVRAMPANSRVRVIGFNWTLQDFDTVMELYDHLDTMRGTNENNDNVETAQLYGTIHVPTMTTDQLREAKGRYNDISITADAWTYRVRFFDGDTLLHTEMVQSGGDVADPVTAGTISTPEKESVGHTGYLFNGWDKALTNITADRDVYAQYTETHAYEVTFKNWDDTILLVKLVPEGATCADPVQTGEIETPTKPGDANYVYSFLGWTGAGLRNVTSDRTVTASYSTLESYTIRFLNWDNSVLLTLYLQRSAQIPDPIGKGLMQTPERPMDASYRYTFTQWRLGTKGSSYYTTEFPLVTGNLDFYAQYSSVQIHTLTIKDWDGTTLYQGIYDHNTVAPNPVTGGLVEYPTRESDGTYNYTFWNWVISSATSTSISAFPKYMTANVTVYARYRTDQYHTVTFTQDGTNGAVLDVQTVLDLDDAVDPITSGRITTPLKSSTAQYDYTFKGWSRGFADVTGDITVKATYTASTRAYWVFFMDEETELARAKTFYNYAAVYTGVTEKLGDSSGLLFLKDWNPTVNMIQAETITQAVWGQTIPDTWAEIFAAEADGTYKDKYHVGDMKKLDLGEEGIVVMRIVGFDKDDLADGSGKAPISWVAATAPKTKVPFDYYINSSSSITRYSFVKKTSDELGEYYESVGHYSNSANTGLFTVTANEETDMTVWGWASSEEDCDQLVVFLNDGMIHVPIGNLAGESFQCTYHMSEGESLVFHAQYSKDSNKDVGQDMARIRFLSDGDITVTMTTAEVKKSPNPEGWKGCQLRHWLKEHIMPLIPAEVRNQIKTVTKYSSTSQTDRNVYVTTEDDLWVPSKREVRGTDSNSNYAVEIGAMYDEYYVLKNSTENNAKRVLTYNGVRVDYFTRGNDPVGGSTSFVDYTGFPPNSTYGKNPKHVALGFCT